MENRILIVARTACFLTLACATGQAANISFQGNFSGDDQVQPFNLTDNSTATVTMVSFAYGGGTNAAGTVVPAGGFDTFFTLFAADGSMINTSMEGAASSTLERRAAWTRGSARILRRAPTRWP